MRRDTFSIRRKHAAASIPIYPLQSLHISLAAKGLLALLLSFGENWEIRMSDIIARSKNGRDSTRRAINELVKAGYIKRIYIRDNGKIKGSQYIVFDEPEQDA